MMLATGECVRGLRRHGFTLIELLIVTALMVVFAGMAFPDLQRSVEGHRYRSAVEGFGPLISSLRDKALIERQVVHLVFDGDHHGYQTFVDGRETTLKRAAFPAGVRVESDREEVLFYPDGRVDPVRIVVARGADEQAVVTTQGVWGGVEWHFL